MDSAFDQLYSVRSHVPPNFNEKYHPGQLYFWIFLNHSYDFLLQIFRIKTDKLKWQGGRVQNIRQERPTGVRPAGFTEKNLFLGLRDCILYMHFQRVLW
jgi:hypothetical protein